MNGTELTISGRPEIVNSSFWCSSLFTVTNAEEGPGMGGESEGQSSARDVEEGGRWSRKKGSDENKWRTGSAARNSTL